MAQLYLKGVYYDTESEGLWFLNNSGTYEEIDTGGGSSYLVYTALISQSGADDPQTATSGLLTIGVSYEIDTYVSGDDFTNIGASSNTQGVRFVATGTTPAVWTNGTTIGWNNGAPILVSKNSDGETAPIQNTLGADVILVYDSVGTFRADCEGVFTEGKTICLPPSINLLGGVGNEKLAYLNRSSDDSCDLAVLDGAFAPIDGFNEMFIEIRVYP